MLDADGGAPVARGQAEELALRPIRPQFADLHGRSAKVTGEEFGETGVHGSAGQGARLGATDCYERRPPRSLQACSGVVPPVGNRAAPPVVFRLVEALRLGI